MGSFPESILLIRILINSFLFFPPTLQKQVLAKLVGRPDAGESELYSLVFEKVGKDQARLQAIKE